MKISVIIPVYNASKYIRKCLDSILNQNFEEYEIILVNDGSTDDSLDVIEEYKNKHTNIVCITQENMGQGEARNKGINIAKGEYIAFIDSDDWIGDEYLNTLYESIVKSNSDISVCNMARVIESGNVVIPSQPFGFIEMSGEKAVGELLLDNKLSSYPWGKLYRKEIFTENNIEFPARMFYEDLAIINQVFIYSKKVIFSEYIGYFYLQTPQSSTRTPNPKNITDRLKALEMVKNTLNEVGKYEHYEKKYRHFCLFHMYLMLDTINKWKLSFTYKYVIKEVEKLINVIDINESVINETMLNDTIKGNLRLMIKSERMYKVLWYHRKCMNKIKNIF